MERDSGCRRYDPADDKTKMDDIRERLIAVCAGAEEAGLRIVATSTEDDGDDATATPLEALMVEEEIDPFDDSAVLAESKRLLGVDDDWILWFSLGLLGTVDEADLVIKRSEDLAAYNIGRELAAKFIRRGNA